MSLFSADWDIQVQKMLPPIVRAADFVEVADDFKVGDNENQVIDYLIESSPGHWKEFPTIGVAIWKYLQSVTDPQTIQRAIRVQLQNDIFPRPLVDARGFPVIIVNAIVIELE